MFFATVGPIFIVETPVFLASLVGTGLIVEATVFGASLVGAAAVVEAEVAAGVLFHATLVGAGAVVVVLRHGGQGEQEEQECFFHVGGCGVVS